MEVRLVLLQLMELSYGAGPQILYLNIYEEKKKKKKEHKRCISNSPIDCGSNSKM